VVFGPRGQGVPFKGAWALLPRPFLICRKKRNSEQECDISWIYGAELVSGLDLKSEYKAKRRELHSADNNNSTSTQINPKPSHKNPVTVDK
jgi:hypothetical protein